MREYETDRWRIISTKVGSGFSPTACKEKAIEIIDPSQAQNQQSSLGDLGDLEGGVEDDDNDDSPIYDQGHGGLVHGLGGGGHHDVEQPGSASSEVGPQGYQ